MNFWRQTEISMEAKRRKFWHTKEKQKKKIPNNKKMQCDDFIDGELCSAHAYGKLIGRSRNIAKLIILPLVRSSDYGIFLVELKKSRKKNPPLKIPLRVNDFGVLDILADCTSNTNKK